MKTPCDLELLVVVTRRVTPATGAGSEAVEGTEDFGAAPHLISLPAGEVRSRSRRLGHLLATS